MHFIPLWNTIHWLLCSQQTRTSKMQMAGCLKVLCLFVFLECSAGACTRPDPVLHCRPTNYFSSGYILSINCFVDGWEDLLGSRCESVGSRLVSCRCGGEPCDCDLERFTRRWDRRSLRSVAVDIYNATISGDYTVSIETTCGHAVSNVIKINIEKPQIYERVFLQCEATADEVVSGQHLTTNCVLTNRGLRRLRPCRAKGGPGLTCHCSGEPCHCQLKTINNRSNVSWIQNATVEVYNVTNTGIYDVSMETTCGLVVQDSIKINVTTPLTN